MCPSPVLSHTLWLDAVHYGTDQLGLRAAGLVAASSMSTSGSEEDADEHDLALAAHDGDEEQIFIGLEFKRRGCRVAVRAERIWRLRMAIPEVLRRGKVSGHALRCILVTPPGSQWCVASA